MLYGIDVIELLRNWTNRLWLVLMLVWLLSAVNSKRTVKAQSWRSRLWQTGTMAAGLALVFANQIPLGQWDRPVMDVTLQTALWGLVLTAVGLGFSIWARLTLGANWSGVVTLKEGHTLIVNGPYQWVRHPIYSGLLLALLGSALQFGEARSFGGVLLCGLAFWMKSVTEEELMVERFGQAYLDYRRHVSALFPLSF